MDGILAVSIRLLFCGIVSVAVTSYSATAQIKPTSANYRSRPMLTAAGAPVGDQMAGDRTNWSTAVGPKGTSVLHPRYGRGNAPVASIELLQTLVPGSSVGLQPPISYPTVPSGFPTGEPADIVTADFNGDGYADLAVADGSNGVVSVLLNNGNAYTNVHTAANGGGEIRGQIIKQ